MSEITIHRHGEHWEVRDGDLEVSRHPTRLSAVFAAIKHASALQSMNDGF